MVDASTRAERLQILAFIQADPSVITLKRRPKSKTGAGGYTFGDPVDVPPQTFRLVPFKRRLTHGTVAGGAGGEGNVVSLPYVLVGKFDADVEPDDYFDYNGLRYEVLSLEPNRRIRTAAELIDKGGA